MFKLQKERLDLDNPLGDGSFGEVFPYQKDPNDPADVEWAVKRIIARNTTELFNCLPEIVLGFSCDHPCIVAGKGYFIEECKDPRLFQVYLKIHRMKESLFKTFEDRKTNKNPFDEAEIIKYFYSIVCGLQYLHDKRIYHGDIRHQNLLLDAENNLKIADIGLAKYVADEDSYQTVIGIKGTPAYTAPEVLREKVKKLELAKADIWSLGVVVLELCVFQFRLFKSLSNLDDLRKKVEQELKSLEGKYHHNLISLIEKMLSIDPDNRPSLAKIKDEIEKNFLQILVYLHLRWELIFLSLG